MQNFIKTASIAALTFVGGAIYFAMPAQAATCIGNCGHNNGTVDGVIVPAPGNFGEYDWVSTRGGLTGTARIAGYSGAATNGSELLSDPFFAQVGQKVSFNFNYVTSDGAQFADYGFAQLINTTTNAVIQLFNARTKPSGNIVPGQELPPVVASLSPAEVVIKPGGPVWSPLGGSSGACYSTGCGYTGWIHSEYVIPAGEQGTYQLRFGASNWLDTAYDSGLAFSGLLLDGATIGDGSAYDSPLLPGEVDQTTGEFVFEFVATPQQTVWVDPEVSVGYDFVVNSGPNFLTADLPDVGDLDGYDIYLLSDLDTPYAHVGPGGGLVDFGPGGVSAFKVLGIDPDLLIDPTDQDAFITGLTFAVQSGETTINMSMTPITTFVPDGPAVPEPTTWAMMIGGFAMIGGLLRRRRGLVLRFT